MVRLSTICLFVALAVPAVAVAGPETVRLRSQVDRERQMLRGPRGPGMGIDFRRPSLPLGINSDIGDVCHRYAAEYRPWQWSAYAGAGWLCRAPVLTSAGNQRYEEALERYALIVVALNYQLHNAVSFVPPVYSGAQPPTEPAQARETLSTLPVPEVDEEALAPEQRALWADTRSRFRTVSARVHRARVLLDELSFRLSERGLTINRTSAATAVKMQGFLEDAVEFIQALQFEHATEALVRSDYERAKLKTVIGQ